MCVKFILSPFYSKNLTTGRLSVSKGLLEFQPFGVVCAGVCYMSLKSWLISTLRTPAMSRIFTTEVFWFPFAIGTIGGIIFSVIAMLLYLPVFCFGKRRQTR